MCVFSVIEIKTWLLCIYFCSIAGKHLESATKQEGQEEEKEEKDEARQRGLWRSGSS